jgi:hypothetical protein
VAVYALQFAIPVLHDGLAIHNNGLMALFAGDLLMRPFEFKSRIVVIKLASVPFIEAMASFTICNPILFKLVSVNIVVAGNTCLIQRNKRLFHNFTGCIFLNMAACAADFCMLTGKLK